MPHRKPQITVAKRAQFSPGGLKFVGGRLKNAIAHAPSKHSKAKQGKGKK